MSDVGGTPKVHLQGTKVYDFETTRRDLLVAAIEKPRKILFLTKWWTLLDLAHNCTLA